MKQSLAFRQVSKRLSYRKRYLSLSSIEQVRLRRLKKFIMVLMCKIKTTEDKEEKFELHGKLRHFILLYFSTITSMDDGLEECPRYDRTIQSFSESDCKIKTGLQSFHSDFLYQYLLELIL